MNSLRLLLFPFALLYGFIIWIRNRLFDLQILKSKTYPIPTIVVGNLAIGGTGKSPMTEFIIKILKDKYCLATLSRGYGRKTKGFKYVSISSTADEVGDEPLQFKNKFSDITVAVCEDRCLGVETLMEQHDVIILDDAFQHRKLKPTFSILLFDYNSCQNPMFVLPMGNFRDLPGESKRADMIMVTKTPSDIPEDNKAAIRRKLYLKSGLSNIFFTSIQYGELVYLNGNRVEMNANTTILLLTGIANPKPLLDYLTGLIKDIEHFAFSDHHAYTSNDILTIKQKFDQIKNPSKLIITTEKDAQRIRTPEYIALLDTVPVAYIPIEIAFDDQEYRNTVEQQLLSICGRSVNES
jgi:tetraacyldisaccharide 4'-kinase